MDLPVLPSRPIDSHKGSFGHGLIVGGSLGMTGAAVLSGSACLRCGAGLVTIAVPENSQSIVAAGHPCYMTLGLPISSSKQIVFEQARTRLKRLEDAGAILAVGPGLGRSADSDRLAIDLFNTWNRPAIFDADALNALSESSDWADMLKSKTPTRIAGRVLTPHPGEWSRLTGIPAKDRDGQKQAAHEIASKRQIVVVLKGHRTWITDGTRSHENETGNPSLAVGGSGDCLTGILLALQCQGLTPYDASVLGVHLHGLAADIAHGELQTPSTLGTDLIQWLPAAFRKLRSTNANAFPS